MLNKLFRPKWQHPDPAARIQAINRLGNEEQAIFEQIARHDENAEARHAAIARIDNLHLLFQSHKQTDYPDDRDFIRQCWCAILSDYDLTSPERAEQIILGCEDPLWLAAIAIFSNNESQQELALTGLRDENSILHVMQSSRHGHLWQQLVKQLHSEEALRQALDITHDRDKRSSQLVRQKLDAIQQKKSHETELEQQAQHLAQKLEKLVTKPDQPQFEGLLLSLEQQWQTLSEQYQGDLAATIAASLQHCRQHLLQQQEEKQQEQHEREQRQNLDKACQALLDELTEIPELSEEQLQRFEQLQQQAQTLPDHNTIAVLSPLTALIKTLQTLEPFLTLKNLSSDQITELDNSTARKNLDQLDQAIDVCRSNTVTEQKLLSEFAVIKKQLQQQQRQSSGEQHEQQQKIRQWINEADQAIANDDLQEAHRLYQKIRSSLEHCNKEQRSDFTPAIQRIQAATRTLQDWKAFATEPKRRQLCEEMQKLIDADIPPQHKATAVRDLQDQWKALGFCHNQAIWQTFRELGQQAFEPCKQYFAEQKDKKAFNAQQRTIICEQIEQLLENIDWQACDYKGMEKLLNATDSEWKKYSPVEHKAHKSLQKRYYDSINTIREQLNSERERNTRELEHIVAEAQALNETDDVQQAIDDYRQLHEKWKQTGISFHKQQQQLWQALKEAGDTLYNRRGQQNQQAEQALQENLQKAESLIADIYDAAQAKEPEKHDIGTLKKAFHELGALPKNCWQKTENHFRLACDNYRAACQVAEKNACFQQIEQVRQWADSCLEQEKTGAMASAPIPQTLPGNWQNHLSARLTSTPGFDGNQARELCIALEILCDIPSPENDAALRMQMQVDKLAEHFAKADDSDQDTQFINICLQWSALPGDNSDDYQQLSQRFWQLAETMLSQQANQV